MTRLIFGLLWIFSSFFAYSQDKEIIENNIFESGNTVSFLEDGKVLHDARTQLLMNAKESIYLASFSIATDIVGNWLTDLLCQKAKEGLEVRLTYDHRNNISFFNNAERLKSCGVYLIAFRSGDRLYAAHEKLLIVDGKEMIIGGSGWSRKYLLASPSSHEDDSELRQIQKTGWYDADYLIKGPSACSMHNLFRNNFIHLVRFWQDYNPDYFWYGPEEFSKIYSKYYGFGYFKGCQPVKTDKNEKTITLFGQPNKNDARPILKVHESAINQTKEGDKILLYSPYFVPHGRVVKALTDALKRGVPVTIITNSLESTDEKFFGKPLFIGMIKVIPELLKHGAVVKLWNQKSTLHRKGGLIGNLSFFGSDNLDYRGQIHNSETVVYTDSLGVKESLENDFKRDLALSRDLSQEYIDRIFQSASLKDFIIAKTMVKWSK